jgi:hypothetical protein
MSALAFVLCDLLHELGHLAATKLPLGVRAQAISTIGVTTDGSSAVVAVAGSAVNLFLALSLLVALASWPSPAWRWFSWLLGTINLFNAGAYLLYSAILGSGDWAVVLGSAPPALWRTAAGLAGAAAYTASVYASLAVLRRLVACGVVASENAGTYCAMSYWIGGTVLTVGAILNPVSPWLILTSGAATGFGAMAGLIVLPSLLHGAGSLDESLRIGWTWVAAGAVAVGVFIGVFGPGLVL